MKVVVVGLSLSKHGKAKAAWAPPVPDLEGNLVRAYLYVQDVQGGCLNTPEEH